MSFLKRIKLLFNSSDYLFQSFQAMDRRQRVRKVRVLKYFAGLFIGITLFLCVVENPSSFSPFNNYVIFNRFEDIYVSKAAENLPLNSSIFVWAMTATKFHDTRVKAINSTWLNRLKHGVVFSSEPLKDERIPFHVAFKNFDDSYKQIFHKTRFGFYYAYKGISDKFDWYVRADDNTYLVVENLERYLKTLDPNKPIYAGYKWNRHLESGYNSGSFYILSRAAMKIFTETLYEDHEKCPFDTIEDRGIGRCLATKDIFPISTRDAESRDRFQPFNTWDTFEYYGNTFKEFPSDLISLHYLDPNAMMTADLFLYRISKQ